MNFATLDLKVKEVENILKNFDFFSKNDKNKKKIKVLKFDL